MVSKVTTGPSAVDWLVSADARANPAVRISRTALRAAARARSENGGSAGTGFSAGIRAKPRLRTTRAARARTAYRNGRMLCLGSGRRSFTTDHGVTLRGHPGAPLGR